MQDVDWPPGEVADWSLQIILRLDSLCSLTQVRRAKGGPGRAEVAVWPFNDEIVAAVRERLAPLETLVEPQDWLPSPGSKVGPIVWIAGQKPTEYEQ